MRQSSTALAGLANGRPASAPPGLEPDLHEHGLVSGDLTSLAADIDRAWELFEGVAAEVDPDAPSRKQGWTARELIARLGQWESGRTLSDLLADAHDGDAGYYDADAVDEQVRAATADLPFDDVLAGLSAGAGNHQRLAGLGRAADLGSRAHVLPAWAPCPS